VRPRQRLANDLPHTAPDLGCVVLHPSRPRQYLAVLLLAHAHDGSGMVEDDGPGARRALVDREDITGVVAHQSRLSRTTRRRVLPMRDFGSSLTSTTRRGTLYAVRSGRTCVRTASLSKVAPGRSTTAATTSSPLC